MTDLPSSAPSVKTNLDDSILEELGSNVLQVHPPSDSDDQGTSSSSELARFVNSTRGLVRVSSEGDINACKRHALISLERGKRISRSDDKLPPSDLTQIKEKQEQTPMDQLDATCNADSNVLRYKMTPLLTPDDNTQSVLPVTTTTTTLTTRKHASIATSSPESHNQDSALSSSMSKLTLNRTDPSQSSAVALTTMPVHRQRCSVAGTHDLAFTSPQTSGIGPASASKTKLNIPFFKQKPITPTPHKSFQMKELRRMIRAGRPSFEQIHSWGHSFEKLLNDRFGLALFKDFLSTEFSDENIEFWIACQEYKQISNPKKLASRAQRIFYEFIAVQANREVNLDSQTRLQTEADLVNPSRHTLDNAQKRIQALMEKDSYRRFLRSEVYLTLYSEAREVAKAAAASALAASLQQASDELDGAVLNLITCSQSQSTFGFLTTHLTTPFSGTPGTGLHLPGVAAAAASAEAGMNNIQDLQLLGLSTSRHMRNSRIQSASARSLSRKSLQTKSPDETASTAACTETSND